MDLQEIECLINQQLHKEGNYPDLRFRFYRMQDEQEVMNLYRSMLGKEGVTWNEDYPNEEDYEKDSESESIFGFVDEQDRIVSAISIDHDDLVKELPLWSHVTDEHGQEQDMGELARLAVRKDYQNRGIARQMILIGIEILKLRGFAGMHYLVSEHNTKAVASYRKLNFTFVGKTELYGHEWMCYETLFLIG